MTRLLALCAVLLWPLFSPAYAINNDLLITRWGENARFIQQEVLQPLNQKFEQATENQEWWRFTTAFLNEIRERRENLELYSYDMMREIILSIDEVFATRPEAFTWQDASRYIDIHLHLVGSVISTVTDELDRR